MPSLDNHTALIYILVAKAMMTSSSGTRELLAGAAASAMGIKLAFRTARAAQFAFAYLVQWVYYHKEEEGGGDKNVVQRWFMGGGHHPTAYVVKDLGAGAMLLTSAGIFYVHMPLLEVFEMNLMTQQQQARDYSQINIILRPHAYGLFCSVSRRRRRDNDDDEVQGDLENHFKTFVYECLVHMILNDIRTTMMTMKKEKIPHRWKNVLRDLKLLMEATLFSARSTSSSSSSGRQAASTWSRWFSPSRWFSRGDEDSRAAAALPPKNPCFLFLEKFGEYSSLVNHFALFLIASKKQEGGLFFLRTHHDRDVEQRMHIGIPWEAYIYNHEIDSDFVQNHFRVCFSAKTGGGPNAKEDYAQSAEIMNPQLFSPECVHHGRLGYTLLM